MSPTRPQWSRRIGSLLLFAMLGLIAGGALIKGLWPGDVNYWLVRWPVWILVGVAVPFIALRVVLWRRQQRTDAAPPADAA